MKCVLAVSALTLGLLLGGAAQANEDLAKANGCMTCNQIDKKVLGPAYKDVAAKYRSDTGAEATLVKKVKEGGKGVWGEMVMPPNAHVNDADIATLVKWILTLK